ncbi:bidirectional sugar transporter SWEET5-like [Humulus lupulus]|uniref:bidirectional sugar transporter SWEET5-like n=1 Tax=Humulus lupulus TaxID=3486 RepID=UPI002B40A118|nr:bidirectional sugar transporter SWEET5-like [Humulus lupulus]
MSYSYVIRLGLLFLWLLCMIFSMIAYAPPLSAMKTVYLTKSVEYMLFLLSLVFFLVEFGLSMLYLQKTHLLEYQMGLDFSLEVFSWFYMQCTGSQSHLGKWGTI